MVCRTACYVNRKPAVVQVLRIRDRVESDRFFAVRSHYGFDSFFSRPPAGMAPTRKAASRMKSADPDAGTGCWRRKVASLTALNEKVAAATCSATPALSGVTVAAAFADEQPVLLRLPAEPFDCARLLYARVDTHARVSVRGEPLFRARPLRGPCNRSTRSVRSRPRCRTRPGRRPAGDQTRRQGRRRGLLRGAFHQSTAGVNGASQLIGAVVGPEIGEHARSAVGVDALPLNAPVEVETIVEV